MPSQVSPVADESLTLDMVVRFTYCPRLFHLMYVEGRWADNAYTIDGRRVHSRIDRVDHLLPDAGGDDEQDAETPAKQAKNLDGDEPPTVSRSVPLSSESLGVTAKLDLVATDGDEALPVETKRSRVPSNPERSYEPERVQLMVQGLLLREAGYRCERGVLYFAGSKTRVDVPFTEVLETRARELITQTKAARESTAIPPPLDDSPKCRGCSLNGICLPDETLALREVPALAEEREGTADPSIRRLYPAREDATPLYVQEQGAFVGKSGQRLVVRKEGQELSTVRLIDTSQLVLCGNIGVSAQLIHLLCEASIPIVHLSMGHWFYGVTQGITLRNAFDRAAKFEAAAQPARCLDFAKRLVLDKAANQRTMLRRNAAASRELDFALRDIDDLVTRVPEAASLGSLLGLEGNIAAKYFARFADMLRPRDFDSQWDFTHRNRRPPRDPVNAMLSFVYALLVKECTVALLSEGLDPWWGFYHQPRHGRPALALDLMEPFRPTVADSVVVTAINTGMVTARSFEQTGAGCMLRDPGRKAVLRAYEARLDHLVTHPVFGYRCSWRSVIRMQARLLSRWLRGDVPRFENVVTR